MALFTRIKNAWNAFKSRDQTGGYQPEIGSYASSFKPDRFRLYGGSEKSIVTSIYNRMAVDASSLNVRHVKTNKEGYFEKVMDTPLNKVLSFNANLDQTGRAFMEDAVYTLLDEGCIAIVPIITDTSPIDNSAVDVYSLRVATIAEWYADSVRVYVYNELKGQREYLVMPKSSVAIIENPFYAVMNESNSTLQRLKKKLSLLDVVDEKAASKKLDIIIQMPYMIKSEYQNKQAKRRVKDIETQLADSQWGIAYTDGTERITQLNRPVENNLLSQVEYLTKMLYSQLSITEEIMNGTANENVINNYYSRTIEPVISAIVDGMSFTFLTDTALTQGQRIMYFRDPFKLLTLSSLATIADTFKRNEIMSSNEFRGIMALAPSASSGADELLNPNINPAGAGGNVDAPVQPGEDPQMDAYEEMLDGLESDIDNILANYNESG